MALMLALAVPFTPTGPTESRAAEGHQGLFHPESFTLDNGLQVVVITDRRVPVVSHTLWYKVGAADEEPGQSGLAHLLEHLMFKGTKAIPAGSFSRIVARNGGQENAFTSYDYTGYFQNIAVDRLELVMGMEADRMTGLVLDDHEIASEKRVVLEERRQRVENDPAAILAEETDTVRFVNHPYRRPIIGWVHEVETLDKEHVLAFYRRWYAPENAVLVVAGDISASELRPLAERTYGRIPGRRPPDRVVLSEPDVQTNREIQLRDPRVRQPSWIRSWLAPSYGTNSGADPYVLQVLEEALSGGSTSLFYRSIVVEQALAVTAGLHYDPNRRGPSIMLAYASPRQGVSLDQLQDAMSALIDGIVQGGVDEDEVIRAKRRLAADAIYARDQFSTAARILGQSLAIGRSVEDVEVWPECIAAVTPEQVNEMVRILFAKPTVTSRLEGATAAESQASTVPPTFSSAQVR